MSEYSAGDIEVVIYDSLYPVQNLSNTTSTFVVEPKPAAKPAPPAPAPAPKPSAPEVIISGCEEDLKRKQEIRDALGCC